MAKIFLSYKYGDGLVASLPAQYANNEGNVTARSYVTLLQEILRSTIHINKGETDDASLEDFKSTTIQTKLGRKIFDSSVTIVLISKGMQDRTINEQDQWIPWEIRYSLRSKSRRQSDGRILYSKPNAMIAVILPDENDSYDYAVLTMQCGVTQWRTSTFFRIIRNNMFNIINPTLSECEACSGHHRRSDHSYIVPVKWSDFITDQRYETYILHALELRKRIGDFKVSQKIEATS